MNRARSFFLVFFLLALAVPYHTYAADTSGIQSQIDTINSQKAALDAEIAKDQKQLNALAAQHQTLQSTIQTLTITQSQLGAKISSTQKSISAANLQLSQLGTQIGSTQSSIDLEKAAVSASLKDIQSADDISLPEIVFSAGTLTEAWSAVEADQELALTLQGHTKDLSNTKTVLTTHQSEVNAKKKQLSDLNAQLLSQNKQLTANKQAQQTLLSQTKNQESTYQQLIATKKAQEAAFEKTLADLQAQLAPVGSASIPAAGSGILSWPFSAAVMGTCPGKSGALGNIYCVTQFFGNTSFAQAHAAAYNGMGHDGIDIGVPIGTPVLAALSGTVLATGNTDVRSPSGALCYSFGKWVMLQHANGLDTLYAHLSSIEVSKGQSLGTGQELGLSGMTGYATGPHLHFGVYAGAGVQIMDLGKWRGSGGTPCTDAGAVLPVAPNNAYLNPISYL